MNKKLSIEEIQKIVDKWVTQFPRGYFSPLSQLAQLTEEVGELARVINRKYGSQIGKTEENLPKELADELADVLFVIVCIANNSGVDLAKAFE